VFGGVSMYVGAAVAVGLFDVASPAGVAWLRVSGAAVVLLAWRRPGRAAWRGKVFWLAGLFGVVTALMNVAFYESIDRLPLGTAVALEFVGPVLVAAFGSRSVRDIGALSLVVSGVVLIADVRWAGSTLGVLFALSAAVLWAGYIVLGKRVASLGLGVDGLAVGFGVATVLLSPLAFQAGPVWTSPRLLVLGVGVGVLSTVVPYALDQVVLRRTGQAAFALLLALLPVTATAVGLVVLRQVPTLPEALGILAVVVGLTMRTRDRAADPLQPSSTRARAARE
jgi:inner membrane transporter RhtA